MKTILLIEDNALIRANVAELLGLAGYAVDVAADGPAGVALAQARPPDLVVCDILLPGLDGYGVLARLRQTPRLAGVPFLFLTAKTERADQRRGMALGADDYLSKPFDEAELLGAIAGRLTRFQHLRPDYDLRAAGGLDEFLDDARATAQLAELTDERAPHAVRRKQDIYHAGDPPAQAYFVQAGRVKTVKTTAGGKELITGFYGPSEFFGYLPLLDHSCHAEAAVTVEDSALVYISPADFMALLLRHAGVGQQFIRLLAGRVREREEQLLGMAYSSIRRRVADALLQLHQQASDPDAGLQLSREDLAAAVGTAPESVIRTLSGFNQDGLIELAPRAIRVLQPEKLRCAHW